ncbi:ribonuclease HII [Achromobacter mucicolens]|jgi:ribonuclease HII|uniref:Ribonuclease HII n=1 Tax=Achromobacter mucicolens TaxID=1389922 RepID=A0ABM8LG69_9BURK|nr:MULTISPECIES: ribonuclease HII [Achromobacter]MCP2513837.1 ribonuclease HII [Achromobacter mucicolens]MCU6618836.1 ribonuclease HII [Achromobacter mucicolens]MDG9971383.1 ribonuclease HII [Achromobacter mucicolens]UDG77822.1 ribonuclease HII [Achromobacter sp. 77]WBX90518.1 ribonuclease HII [Achromobacter mucicolens]
MEQPELFVAPEQPALLTAGVDEAGRGPLAGEVYAAAVILDPSRFIDGLADSKVLTAVRREELALQIKEQALAWCIASATVAEIDSLNILRATMLAMQRAVQGLATVPQLALVDGNQAPKLRCTVQTVIKGDALVPAISAASILAKTARDADLLRLHALYPQYAFDQHKGYGTALHLQRLREHGPCAEHRRSFAPIKAFGLVS